MFKEIKTISIQDKNYPELLKKIKNPPAVLYVRGEIFSDENCFAIVGARLCSPYGKQVAGDFSADITDSGLTVVSGLAPGIDTASHWAAVERKKRTIAVLGTGVDAESVYPQSNLKLSQKILETGGCLLSEYPPGTPGNKFTFPQRNRIISGLSLGVLVVEAKEKSGALITAEWAKQQGKKIFAIPGPIHSQNSKGCHFLIKNGAKLAENANDILKDLNLKTTRPGLVAELSTGIGRPGLVAEDNKEEVLILNILQEALDIEKIIEKTNLSASTIASTLAILEIKNKVRNLGGNIYAINRS